ncbi:hypothetical protein COCNU_02G003480 [Cocos nucifera]|uniref:Uncharacterized protein n=1 Tax=Cocos nucifera TaxID=13894 RepID=A0A8K0MW32_COCNU|nr:hypothetical protein COCNU_02G003480 [Cocos nucifera]
MRSDPGTADLGYPTSDPRKGEAKEGEPLLGSWLDPEGSLAPVLPENFGDQGPRRPLRSKAPRNEPANRGASSHFILTW